MQTPWIVYWRCGEDVKELSRYSSSVEAEGYLQKMRRSFPPNFTLGIVNVASAKRS